MGVSHLPEKEFKPLIGITCGDLNGIGLEVIIKTFSDIRVLTSCTPIIYCSSKAISTHRKILQANDFNYQTIKDASAAIDRKVNLINCWDEEVKIELGTANAELAKYAVKSLECASADLLKGAIHAVVTAPIQKELMNKSGFGFPGHTEFFAKQFNTKDYLMLMVAGNLRVAVATGHISLKEVAAQLSTDKIIRKLKVMHHSFKQDFGITVPKIAVLGLNPHAGDNGTMGNEEKELIMPAIKKLQQEGMLVYGPYPADGFFASGNMKNFDGVLAMYHDQGLTPFKTIAFDDGVNFTAGLPIVRTSPDHGTAFDIAGKNMASESSFRCAIYTAIDIIDKRIQYAELTENPLQISVSKFSRDQ